jgi:hypothetical protein
MTEDGRMSILEDSRGHGLEDWNENSGRDLRRRLNSTPITILPTRAAHLNQVQYRGWLRNSWTGIKAKDLREHRNTLRKAQRNTIEQELNTIRLNDGLHKRANVFGREAQGGYDTLRHGAHP